MTRTGGAWVIAALLLALVAATGVWLRGSGMGRQDLVRLVAAEDLAQALVCRGVAEGQLPDSLTTDLQTGACGTGLAARATPLPDLARFRYHVMAPDRFRLCPDFDAPVAAVFDARRAEARFWSPDQGPLRWSGSDGCLTGTLPGG